MVLRAAGSPSPSPSASANPDDFQGFLQAAKELGIQIGATGGASSSYPGPVYMGPKKPIRMEGRGWLDQKGDNWVPGDQAAVEYNSWSAKRRADFVAQAKIAGLVAPDGGDMEGANIWRTLVQEASYFGVDKKQKVSPWDILSSYVKARGGGGGAAWQKDPSDPNMEVNRLTGEKRYVGPRFTTATQSSVNFSDPATAAAIATRAFQDLMGRDPGKGELGAFADALHQSEAQNPVITTMTTEHDPTTGQAVGQSSTSSGGVDAAGKQYMAEQRVKGTKEYGVVQAVTNYQNVLENLIWNSPSLGGG